MPVLIDTSIAIQLRDGDRSVRDRLLARGERPTVSLITVVELEGGVYAKPDLMITRRVGVDRMLRRFPVLAFDQPVVSEYAAIVQSLGFSRPRILDRLIAATAIVHDLTLITINGADFRDIPGLELEVWSAPAQ